MENNTTQALIRVAWRQGAFYSDCYKYYFASWWVIEHTEIGLFKIISDPVFWGLGESYHKQLLKESEFSYKSNRYLYSALNEVYFWIITINKWQHLLMPDENKMILINSLHLLVQQQLIKINGSVIMPNHIYLLWEV